VFQEFRPHSVIHLAAETRAHRSIEGTEAFLRTNTIGTLRLLQAASAYFEQLDSSARDQFCFQHVSTSEVLGTEGEAKPSFANLKYYDPLSPYAASKAAADHIVRAWGHTYDLPVIVTNCTNVYGPYQSLEELIPKTIVGVCVGRNLPDLIGSDTIRDWLFVDDLAELLLAVVERGRPGGNYLAAGDIQRSNRQVVTAIADLVDELVGPLSDCRRRDLIAGANEAPTEDYHYSPVEQSRLEKELDWHPTHSFETGLRQTVSWYLENEGWWRRLPQPAGINGHHIRPIAAESARS
jgi:dTDP-glucose 4,6-dehydratase